MGYKEDEDTEPAKLTEKMRAEISNEGKIDDMVKPLNLAPQKEVENEPDNLTGTEITEKYYDKMLKPVNKVSPEDVESEYEASELDKEDDTYTETANAERVKAAPKSTATKRRSIATDFDSKSLSELHTELRKHTEARKKTDLAIKDIEKQLKDLLLAHHSAIRDLKKQVGQLRRSVGAKTRKTAAKGRSTKTAAKKSSSTGQKKSRKR